MTEDEDIIEIFAMTIAKGVTTMSELAEAIYIAIDNGRSITDIKRTLKK